MVSVTISRRDTADTAITAELLLSLHVQSFSLSPGTEVDCSGGGVAEAEKKMQSIADDYDNTVCQQELQ